MNLYGWLIGVASLLLGCDLSRDCNLAGCLGAPLTVALVDESGKGVAARGDISYSSHATLPFDCTVQPRDKLDDADCEGNVLQLDSVYNDDDTLKIRFRLADGSKSEWQDVPLTIEEEELPDFNGPGCSCTVHNGTAEPVTVPVAARLAD